MRELFLTILFSFCLVGCELIEEEIDEGDFDFKSTSTCVYQAKQEYVVLTDITTDFDQSSTSVRTKVVSSTCSNISAGDSTVTSSGRLARVGNSITTYGSSGSETVTVAGNNIDVSLPTNGSTTSNGSTYKVKFTDAYLDTTNDYLVFESDVTVSTTVYNFISAEGSNSKVFQDSISSASLEMVK